MRLQHILTLLAFGSGVGSGYVYIFSLGKNIHQDGGGKRPPCTPVPPPTGRKTFSQVNRAISELIFFQDKRAYDEFTGGRFEFDAAASAVAITAGGAGQQGHQGFHGKLQRRA
ncbi:MAG: hypothetical protein PF442_09435 [Desulfobulbaceae bacterium]|jgi:hypothetical protein|nr:hypothetical protein [Desulfobulbaceae bacterium]